MLKKIGLAVCVGSLALTGSLFADAADNFEDNNPGTAYNDGIQYGDNGGTGFGALTYLGGNNGGLFNGSLDGSRALGIFSGPGATDSQAVGRTVTTAISEGTYSLSASFNVTNNVAFTGFNLKSSLGTALGDGELLSLGLVPTGSGGGNGVLFVTDGTGTHTFSIASTPDLTFQNMDFSISFNTTAQTYAITATVRSNGQVGMFSGTLIDTNGASAGTDPVAAIAFGNLNSGSNQNLIIDNLNLVAVPEPTTLSLLAGPAILGAWFFVRRRRA